MKILVVQNDRLYSRREFVPIAGHEAEVVSSFEEARERMGRACAGTWDLLLTDMLLPNELHNAPYGFMLAVQAALMKFRWVAVLGDARHPMTCLGGVSDCGMDEALFRFGPHFTVNGTQCFFIYPSPSLMVEKGVTNTSRSVALDWDRVLEDLPFPGIP